jgi:hypothetical protein
MRTARLFLVTLLAAGCGGGAPAISPTEMTVASLGTVASTAPASSATDGPASVAPTHNPGRTAVPPPRTTPRVTLTPHKDLVVGDYGFSVDNGDASFAVLLSNPNAETWVAQSVDVQVTFFDDSGPLATETEYASYVLPGQTTAVVGESFDAGHPTRMEVRLGSVDWHDVDYHTGHFEITNVSTKKGQFGDWTTKGTITSTFDERQENIEVFAVYRNSAGEVIGGDFTFLDFVDPDAALSFEINAFFDYKDLDTTEAYWDL